MLYIGDLIQSKSLIHRMFLKYKKDNICYIAFFNDAVIELYDFPKYRLELL